MAKNSWPAAVTSWDDTVKFARLLFGKDVVFENYSDRLPHPSTESVLLFAKRACKAPRPFANIPRLIASQLKDIESYEQKERNNWNNPKKSQQVRARSGGVVYYNSCQVTKAPCSCRSLFGGDSHQASIPTTSCLWCAGREFATLLQETMQTNLREFGTQEQRPVWMDKSWEAVWNKNDHNRGHHIDPHVDRCSTYSSGDPITSFSFGCGGILTLHSMKKTPGSERMLFQEDGDALIMAGNFQSEFQHGVPARAFWEQFRSKRAFASLKEWEKLGIGREIQNHAQSMEGEEHLRFNCTLRWHDTHWIECSEYVAPVPSPVLSGSGLPPASGYVGLKRHASVGEATSVEKASTSVEQAFAEQQKELLQKHQKTVQCLLATLGAFAHQCDAFWSLILAQPWVNPNLESQMGLTSIEETSLAYRNNLFAAAEQVAELELDLPTTVNYSSLNLLVVATQQRREIQRLFGGLRCREGMWIKEVADAKVLNCLKNENDVGWRKLRLSHRQVEMLLEAVDADATWNNETLAVDMMRVDLSVVPAEAPCAGRHPKQAKQHCEVQYPEAKYDLFDRRNPIFIIKGLELMYCSTQPGGQGHMRRLLLQSQVFRQVEREKRVGVMCSDVRQGMVKCLEHLRTLDVEKKHMDRGNGRLVSENYDAWIWGQCVAAR